MIIKISEDLGKEEIWANGMELSNIMGMDFVGGKRVSSYPSNSKKYIYTFTNPVLMTDNYKIGKLEPGLRDTLFSLFQCKPRLIEYDHVSTYWDDTHKGVWCPSIDTLLFAKVLKKFLKENKNLKTGVEIGCGSGFLTKYVLEKSKEINNFLAIDINPYAIKSVEDNIGDERLQVHCGDALKKINGASPGVPQNTEFRGKKFDLIICNPPYVPRPGSIDDNPYEGVSLMRHLIQKGQKYLNDGGVLILNVSSLAEDLVFDKEPLMKSVVLDKMKVPLKVNNIMNNKDWLKYLESKGLEKNMHDGYLYWQELKILEFRK